MALMLRAPQKVEEHSLYSLILMVTVPLLDLTALQRDKQSASRFVLWGNLV